MGWAFRSWLASCRMSDAQASIGGRRVWSRPKLSDKGLVVLARLHLHASQFALSAVDPDDVMDAPLKEMREVYEAGGQEALRAYVLGYAALTGMPLFVDEIMEYHGKDSVSAISEAVKVNANNAKDALAKLAVISVEEDFYCVLRGVSYDSYGFIHHSGEMSRRRRGRP